MSEIDEGITILRYFAGQPSPWREIGFVSVFIVIIIFWYFIYRKLADETNKKEKPLIKEEIKYAISPIIRQLDIEEWTLQDRRYEFMVFHNKGGYLNRIKPIPLLKTVEQAAEATRKHAIEKLRAKRLKFYMETFGSKIDTRNELRDALEKALEDLADLLRPEVDARYPPLIAQYNQTARGQKVTLEAWYTISPIIDNLKELDVSNILHDFWQAHGGELLELRRLPHIEAQINVVDEIAGKLEDLSFELSWYLGRLRSKYIDKFGLTSDEVEMELDRPPTIN